MNGLITPSLSPLLQAEQQNSRMAWLIILLYSLITVAALAGGAGKILNILFPLMSLFVGVFLYFKTPVMFLGFGWWMWFLAPFVRRYADFRSGFTDPSPILMAPYLVGMVAIVTLIKHLPRTLNGGGIAFALPIVAVLYGFVLGLVQGSALSVMRELLDWLVPLLMGFHLFVNWQDFPIYYQNLQRTFVWGVLVTGLYGIFQYVVGPEWDVQWLINTGMTSANGYANKELGAFAIRVFSTMQSAEPFSAFMAAGLLLMLTSKGPLYLPATLAGYLSFLLSMARSGWLGWFGGLITLVGFVQEKYQIRLIATILGLTMLVIPVVTMEPFSTDITERVLTLGSVDEDASAAGRKEAFQNNIIPALSQVVGVGIGGGARDNTTIAIFYALGWPGTILYVIGLSQVVSGIFKRSPDSTTPTISSIRSVMMTALIRLPVNASLFGVSGALLWEFSGMGLAAQKYYVAQKYEEQLYHQSLIDDSLPEAVLE
jgi:hypothetical protein